MQETTNLQQNEGNKVTTTFKCSPATRAQLLTKAAQLDITLSALCEDYIIAGLSAINAPEQASTPAEKPERTLTDTDLKLIRLEQEQALLNFDQERQAEAAEATPESDQDDESAGPVLSLRLTPEQRKVCDQVNEYRSAKEIPALEDSAAEILTGYAMHTYGNMTFKDTNGVSMTAFKKAIKAQADKMAV